MDILLAAMAFAVLMIVFSTAVTSITEAYLRASAVRADVLAKSALQFLKDDPTIQNTIKGWFDTLDDEHLKPALQELRDKAEDYAAASGLVPTQEQIDAFKAKIDALNKVLEDIADDGELDDEAKTAARRMAYKAVPPELKSALGEQAERLAEALQNEAREILVRNPAVMEATDRLGRIVAWLRHAFQGNSAKRIDTLSTYSFLQRLATSRIGRKLAGSAEEYTLRGLTMGFERYVAASNEVFRKRAQAMTMAISILFAFAFNIDAFRLYDYLLNNPTVREELIAEIDRVAAENRATIQAYETVLQQQRQLSTGTPAAADDEGAALLPPVAVDPNTAEAEADPDAEEVEAEADPAPEDDNATADAAADAAPAAASGDDETEQLGAGSGGAGAAGGENSSNPSAAPGERAVPEELQAAIDGVRTAREQVEALSTIGNLPIGWEFFPNPEYQCIIPEPVLRGYRGLRNGISNWWQGTTPVEETVQDKPRPAGARNDFAPAETGEVKDGKRDPCADANFPNFLRWFLNVLLAGFLIGLGGPFWYKVFTSLSHIVSVLRTFRGQPRQEAIGKSTSDQQRASQPMVNAVEKIDENTGPQLVNLFRAAAGLPAIDFPPPVKSDEQKTAT